VPFEATTIEAAACIDEDEWTVCVALQQSPDVPDPPEEHWTLLGQHAHLVPPAPLIFAQPRERCKWAVINWASPYFEYATKKLKTAELRRLIAPYNRIRVGDMLVNALNGTRLAFIAKVVRVSEYPSILAAAYAHRETLLPDYDSLSKGDIILRYFRLNHPSDREHLTTSERHLYSTTVDATDTARRVVVWDFEIISITERQIPSIDHRHLFPHEEECATLFQSLPVPPQLGRGVGPVLLNRVRNEKLRQCLLNHSALQRTSLRQVLRAWVRYEPSADVSSDSSDCSSDNNDAQPLEQGTADAIEATPAIQLLHTIEDTIRDVLRSDARARVMHKGNLHTLAEQVHRELTASDTALQLLAAPSIVTEQVHRFMRRLSEPSNALTIDASITSPHIGACTSSPAELAPAHTLCGTASPPDKPAVPPTIYEAPVDFPAAGGIVDDVVLSEASVIVQLANCNACAGDTASTQLAALLPYGCPYRRRTSRGSRNPASPHNFCATRDTRAKQGTIMLCEPDTTEGMSNKPVVANFFTSLNTTVNPTSDGSDSAQNRLLMFQKCLDRLSDLLKSSWTCIAFSSGLGGSAMWPMYRSAIETFAAAHAHIKVLIVQSHAAVVTPAHTALSAAARTGTEAMVHASQCS